MDPFQFRWTYVDLHIKTDNKDASYMGVYISEIIIISCRISISYYILFLQVDARVVVYS